MKPFVFALMISMTLAACRSNDQWVCQTLWTGYAEFDSIKVSYPSSKQPQEIELELIQNQGKIHGYLNLYSDEFQDPESEVFLHSKGEKKGFLLPCLEGNQRLHLTQECLKYLIGALRNGDGVTIQSGPFTHKIEAQFFDKHLYF